MKTCYATILLLFLLGCEWGEVKQNQKKQILDLVVLDFENLILTNCALPSPMEIEKYDQDYFSKKKSNCRDSLIESKKMILISPYYINSKVSVEGLYQKVMTQVRDTSLWKPIKEFLQQEIKKKEPIPRLFKMADKKSKFNVEYPENEESLSKIFRNNQRSSLVHGAIMVSPFYFTEQGDVCVLKTRFSISPKNSSSSIYVLKRKEGEWSVVEKIPCCGIS